MQRTRQPTKPMHPDELISMPEAALLAYMSASGVDQTITRLHRNDMAVTLAQLLTVYSVSADRRTVRQLAPEDLRGGIFGDGGAVVRFSDERETITGLAVARTALNAAVAALKDARKT